MLLVGDESGLLEAIGLVTTGLLIQAILSALVISLIVFVYRIGKKSIKALKDK